MFQVLDADLVEEKECSSNNECDSVNKRFYEKCLYYDNCGEKIPPDSPQMFSCNTVHYKDYVT